MAKNEKTVATPIAKKVTISEVLDLNHILDKCTNKKDLDPKTVITIIRIKNSLKSIIENFNKEKEEVMKHWNVPANEKSGVYDWTDHPKKDEVGVAVTTLLKTENEIKNLCKIKDSEFVKLTEGLNFELITFLSDFLLEE